MLNNILNKDKSVVKVGNVQFTFHKVTDAWFQIERVFVKKSQRGNGYLLNGLKTVVAFADENKIRLSATFLPDDESYYNTLRNSFSECGFIPDVIGGETYRNDVDRMPN